MQIEPRHDFAYGFTTSRSTRLALTIIIGVIGTPVSIFVGLVAGLIIAFVLDPGGDPGDLIIIPILLSLITGGLFGGWALFSILRVVRTAAWVEGSRLTVQRARARTVDLTRASSIVLRPTRMRWRVPGRADTIPELVVTGVPSTVHMRLSTGEGFPLPPQDVGALMSALSSAGAPGAANVIQYLRAGY